MDKTYLHGAKRYLSRLWPELLEIYPVGVKVFEPHQDGRPHMHVCRRKADIIALTTSSH
nr:hypothetical protein [Ferrovum sp.]